MNSFKSNSINLNKKRGLLKSLYVHILENNKSNQFPIIREVKIDNNIICFDSEYDSFISNSERFTKNGKKYYEKFFSLQAKSDKELADIGLQIGAYTINDKDTYIVFRNISNNKRVFIEFPISDVIGFEMSSRYPADPNYPITEEERKLMPYTNARFRFTTKEERYFTSRLLAQTLARFGILNTIKNSVFGIKYNYFTRIMVSKFIYPLQGLNQIAHDIIMSKIVELIIELSKLIEEFKRYVSYIEHQPIIISDKAKQYFNNILENRRFSSIKDCLNHYRYYYSDLLNIGLVPDLKLIDPEDYPHKEYIEKYILKDKGFSKDQWQKLSKHLIYKDLEEELKTELSIAINITVNIIEELSKIDSITIQSNLASRKDLPDKIINRLSKSQYWYVKQTLIINYTEKVSIDLIEAAFDEKYDTFWVKIAIASTERILPSHIIIKLANDSSKEIRLAIAKRSQYLPKEVIIKLANDPEQEIREIIREKYPLFFKILN